MGLALGGTVAGSQARAVGFSSFLPSCLCQRDQVLDGQALQSLAGDSGEHDGFWWLSQKIGPQSTEATLPCCSHRAAAWFQTRVRSQVPTGSGRDLQLSPCPACRSCTQRQRPPCSPHPRALPPPQTCGHSAGTHCRGEEPGERGAGGVGLDATRTVGTLRG